MSARCPNCRNPIPLANLHEKFACSHCGTRLNANITPAILACLGLLPIYGLINLLLPISSFTAEYGLAALIPFLLLSTALVMWLFVQVFRNFVKVSPVSNKKRRKLNRYQRFHPPR